MTVVAVAAVSARALAESARRGGFDVIALDCFGDEDTREVSRRWIQIGSGDTLDIDGDRFLAALKQLADEGEVRAWVPGAGFEAHADVLARGAALLPMAGTAAADVRRVRDPRCFFAALDDAGIEHPAVGWAPPTDAQGWLVKDAGGRGGWHIRAAATRHDSPLPPGAYFQQEVGGVPMSATFVADGRSVRRLGINRQLVRRFGARPHVFRGVIGPVPLAADACGRVDAALQRLTAVFRLRGLGSLDFMLDGDRLSVLELNPRPPSSFVLHEGGASLLAAHLSACLEERLPAERARDAAVVSGIEIVFARRPLHIGAAAARCLADWPACHDRPRAGSRFATGDPLCSLGATGADADAVEARLAGAREELLRTLETMA